jgi:hypothetical protein
MQELRDPLTLAAYSVDEDTGLVRVSHKGHAGLYTATGEWRSGDHIDVCPHMCIWVGGPNPSDAYSMREALARR